MRFARSPRFASLGLVHLLAAAPLACGDDDGTDSGADTTLVPPATDGSSSAGETSSGTAADASTGPAGVDDSGTTAAAATDDGSTTGPSADPTYPAPDGGACPDGTLPVTLPGAQLCAPFCGGPDDVCPSAATGSATPRCTPFAGEGGSGNPCDDATTCPDGETCSDRSCVAIAFHACQLSCAMDEACPDAMECSGIGTCGYP